MAVLGLAAFGTAEVDVTEAADGEPGRDIETPVTECIFPLRALPSVVGLGVPLAPSLPPSLPPPCSLVERACGGQGLSELECSSSALFALCSCVLL
jgi:hypothetical protein